MILAPFFAKQIHDNIFQPSNIQMQAAAAMPACQACQ